MTPPAAPQPHDRPTTPLPSLASLGRPASNTPPPPAAIAPLYRPVAGGPTVYGPASSYPGAAPTPTQQPLVHAAPPRRWQWFVGGAIVILIIGTVSAGTSSRAPTATIGVPATTAPVTTQRDAGPAPARVPTPSVPAQAQVAAPTPVLRKHAPPRAAPAPTVPRVALPAPLSAAPPPVIAPTPTPVPTATPAPTVTPAPTATPVSTATPRVAASGPGDLRASGRGGAAS